MRFSDFIPRGDRRGAEASWRRLALSRVRARLALSVCSSCSRSARLRRRRRRRERQRRRPTPPVLGADGDDDPQAAQALGFPVFATKNTTRVAAPTPIANAAGVAQAIYPARTARAARRAVVLVDAGDWRAAISAAQLMAGRCARRSCSPTAASCPPRRRPRSRSSRPRAPEGRRRAGRSASATTRRAGGPAQTPTSRAPARPRSPRRSTGCRPRPPARRPRAVVVAPSSRPEFAMPAAAWAAKSGDPVLWTDRDRSPRPRRPRSRRTAARASTCSGPADGDLRNGAQRARQARHDEAHLGRRPGRQRDRVRALHRRRASAGTSSIPATASCSRTRRAPPTPRPPRRSRAPARTGRCCWSPRPARCPPPLQDYLLDIQPGYDDGPGARRLQSRLAHGRRERDLGRRAVADRRAARDPARRAPASRDPRMAEAEQPERLRPTATSRSTTCAS